MQPRVVLRPAVPRQRAAPTRLPSWHRGIGGTLMSKPKFSGTRSNSNGVNRGHEFTVQLMAESFGRQGQAR